jgi:hypothetical protein
MSERIEIHNPIFIAELEGDYNKFIIPGPHDPILYGVAISDLLDHLAAAVHDMTGRDSRDIREQILKVMRDEDRFKEKDPTRAEMTRRTTN